jgi:hypothetical protein
VCADSEQALTSIRTTDYTQGGWSLQTHEMLRQCDPRHAGGPARVDALQGGATQSTFCIAHRETMVTIDPPDFVWINTNEIISSWYLLDAVCVVPPRPAVHQARGCALLSNGNSTSNQCVLCANRAHTRGMRYVVNGESKQSDRFGRGAHLHAKVLAVAEDPGVVRSAAGHKRRPGRPADCLLAEGLQEKLRTTAAIRVLAADTVV